MNLDLLTNVLQYLKNDFALEVVEGTFQIEGGTLILESLKEGQYYRIRGSVFNDGVHMDDTLRDETFTGSVSLLGLPRGFLALFEDIERFTEAQKESGTAYSPYSSESFGGYSYTKKQGTSGTGGTGGGGYSWRDEFGGRLALYKKI